MASSAPAMKSAGIRVPRLGLGTFRLDEDAGAAAVATALELGYRHIDTAERYENERAVGRAVRDSGVPRDEIFVATKFAHPDAEPGRVREAVLASLERLGLGYLDLVYQHWPHPTVAPEATFTALVPLLDEGLVRGLGVSNFPAALVRRAQSVAPIVADQVEMHPYLPQRVLERLSAETGILLTAYAPLAEGRVTSDPVLLDNAAKHGATPAQVALRWLLDKPRTVVIPKSTSRTRLAENLAAQSLQLDDVDRDRIDALGVTPQRFFDPDWAPEWDA